MDGSFNHVQALESCRKGCRVRVTSSATDSKGEENRIGATVVQGLEVVRLNYQGLIVYIRRGSPLNIPEQKKAILQRLHEFR